MTDKERKYNFLCDTMDAIIKDLNPCGFENGECVASRKGLLGEYNTCCRKCRYLGENGCKESVLGCKIYFCGEAKCNLDRITMRRISLLEDKAIGEGFHLIIGEKENF